MSIHIELGGGMRKPSSVRDWFPGTDPSQVNWARQYWTNKARPDLSARMFGTMAVEVLEGLAKLPEGYELLTKMRRAWNTHKSKAKGQRKTYSFVISATADRQLRSLAGGRSKSATLEELIGRGFDLERQMRNERRIEIQKTKEELVRRGHLRAPPTPAEVTAKKKADSLLEELNEHIELLRAALHENCLLRVLLEDAQINPEKLLNAGQQLRANHAFSQRIEYLNRDLASRRRLGRQEARSKNERPE